MDCADKVREIQEIKAKEEHARQELLLALQKSEQDQQQVVELSSTV